MVAGALRALRLRTHTSGRLVRQAFQAPTLKAHLLPQRILQGHIIRKRGHARK